jgi:hypothetical protein
MDKSDMKQNQRKNVIKMEISLKNLRKEKRRSLEKMVKYNT